MNAGGAVWAPSTSRDLVLPFAALTLTAMVTVAVLIVGDGNVLLALAPIVAIAALWFVSAAPIRTTLFLVAFLCLSLDKRGDAAGYWQSPLAPLGSLLVDNLNKTVPIEALKVSLVVMLLGYLLLVRLHRLISRPASELSETGAPAAPMKLALTASFVSAIVLVAYGAARGGDLQMSKIQLQVFVPQLLMAYLLGVSLRGEQDYRTLGRIIVIAACIKAALAVYVRHTLPPSVGTPAVPLEYVTNHGDSMLFACATTILAVRFFERPTRRHGQWMLLLTPLIFAGMVANNRRLAWVQVIASLAVVLVMNPRSRPTRALLRTLIYAAPILLLYGAVGWNSGSRIFAPVRMIHSVGDGGVDRSTLYRDGENYNLVYTFRANPLLGTGFGHPFEEAVQLDDISRTFKEWRYLPHNSILGLWAFTGAIGFTGLWSAMIIAMLLAARSYPRARTPEERAAAIVVMAALIIYMLHCWGDIGFSEWKSIFIAGSALAIAGQLATATGAWGGRHRAPALGSGRA